MAIKKDKQGSQYREAKAPKTIMKQRSSSLLRDGKKAKTKLA